MQEQKAGRSRDDLMKFLNFTGEKGLINKGTVATRKKSCDTILTILDETESADLSQIDLEDVIRRHSVLTAGKFVPATLKGYQGHLRGSIKDFLDFVNNPAGWRPTGKKKPNKAPKPALARRPKEPERKAVIQPAVHIDLHIHIPPEADTGQIEQIFASMRKHLYVDKTS